VEGAILMAQRTTIEKVRAILPSSTIPTDPEIQAAIDAATCVVDQLAETSCGESLSEDCLVQIETYLAAHFAAVTDNTLSLQSESSECCGSTKVTYGFKFGEGIMGTRFGQMANTLSGGCLAEFDKQPVNIFSIGSLGGDAADYM
jgi:hypothetical protein